MLAMQEVKKGLGTSMYKHSLRQDLRSTNTFSVEKLDDSEDPNHNTMTTSGQTRNYQRKSLRGTVAIILRGSFRPSQGDKVEVCLV